MLFPPQTERNGTEAYVMALSGVWCQTSKETARAEQRTLASEMGSWQPYSVVHGMGALLETEHEVSIVEGFGSGCCIAVHILQS